MNRIIGAGLACVDIIHKDDISVIQNGGTCANILSVLSVLGWHSTLLKPLYGDVLGVLSNKIYTELGLELIYYKNSKKPSPRIIERLSSDHEFQTVCPLCHKKLIELELPTRSNIDRNNDSINESDIFIHDRVSLGIDYFIELMHAKNKIVMYEPNGYRNEKIFINHCMKCEIVKFSSQRIPPRVADNLRKTKGSKLRLLIYTNGREGLKFSYYDTINDQMTEWQTILPFKSNLVVDTSGAGDWYTAGFLSEWLNGVENIDQVLNEAQIACALEKARDYAKICSQHLGAQGALCNAKFMSKNKKNPLSNILMDELRNEVYLNNRKACKECFL